MVDLDLTSFGSQRAIPKFALVVIRHVVDREREHHLGLHDDEWIAEQSPKIRNGGPPAGRKNYREKALICREKWLWGRSELVFSQTSLTTR